MPNFILTIFFALVLGFPFSELSAASEYKLPAFSIEKIQQGDLLDKAKSASFDKFFESWLDRNPKKATEGSWIVLYKNDESLFWGWVSFKVLLGSNPTIKEFFKTPITEVNAKLPNYEDIHGNSIREKLEQIITKSIPKKAKVTVILGFSAEIIDETLVIQTPASIKITGETKTEKVNYNVVLNKNNLDLIKIEPL